METTTTKKITLATVKSFINKNNGNIYINVTSSFDGMQDCVMPCQNGFIKAQNETSNSENTYGIAGAWFVGQSRDRFEAHDCETFTGFKVSNACGSFVLAIMKDGVSLPITETNVSEQCSVEVEETTAPIAPIEAPIAPMVGLSVIRKACKRTGKVIAIEGDKVTVELADGSVRRPNVDRFKKLYSAA